jgi:hypothetical protein
VIEQEWRNSVFAFWRSVRGDFPSSRFGTKFTV